MRIIRAVLPLAAILITSTFASAQIPETFTNLQVLPKDISRQELLNQMRTFSFSLGARCDDCHVAKAPGAATRDFASDAKDLKKTARDMMRLVEGVNHDYISKVKPATSTRVECATCHHGLLKPRTLQAVLNEELDKKGLASALALYKDLRKKYYGGGQYDFSETSVNQLTESLLATHKAKEAAAFMELNGEVNTLSEWGRGLTAKSHQANGETAKAITDFQKIVDANPNDEWARKQLEQLKSSKN